MKAKTEKTCLDTQCQEVWQEFPEDFSKYTAKFVYCPICAEELHVQCSNCKEALANTEFKFCPWCGTEFEE
ncbi:MAG: hypothetical protein JRG97_07195 [Deltaproteobacteria bacterium]|nr:hypothetical protein [Deltaproteobacteria bacterium]MBW2052364.1 hypothetical protein [Deltaproteobacteria bacterium]MBW2140843.1 hypothetical protein [Deltaproteobacteria bacterium]MBW2323987.1 hypothetical protein [Deltaproteobacteria bacterium]